MNAIPKIDIEFQALVPPLTHEEKSKLEELILQNGCLESLKVWREENVLIDGHNRLDICTLHNIPYKVEHLSFKSRWEVIIWIVNNQLGRRNTTEQQKSYLRGKRYEAEKKQGERKDLTSDQNDRKLETAERLARELNVSAPTIRRDEKFAKGVDVIGSSSPELRQRILSGEAKVNKQDVQELAALTQKVQQEKWASHRPELLLNEAEDDVRCCYECVHYRQDGHHESRYFCNLIGETFHFDEGQNHDACKFSDDAPMVFESEADILKKADEIRRARKPHVSYNSGENEWYTPTEFLEAARKVMGCIDLDPASSVLANKTVNASRFYSAEEDGLVRAWWGNVWMNPPYEAGLIDKFCSRLKDHLDSGAVKQSIVLVNNATETQWFSTLIACAHAVVFPRKRIRFVSPSGKLGSPLQGQAIIYSGEHLKQFLEVFTEFGWGATI